MTGDCAQKMIGDLSDGMAFSISSWSTFDNWLWKDRCQAGDCTSQQLTFKNINIVTGSDIPVPPVPPTPSDYVYGNECGSKWADDCDGSCDCYWSWPSNEDWSGPDAKCRCKY
jgi:hypothetical protein